MQRLLTVLSLLGLILSSALSGLFILRPSLARAYSSPGTASGYVNDFADVLPEDRQVALHTDLEGFAARTSNEIVIATIETLDGDTVENYANELFRDWGIGDKGRNNGVLLLVAVNDKKVRIEVGYGLEGAITDLESGQIIDNLLLPAFRNGDYIGGIESAVAALKLASEGEYSAPATSKSTGGNAFDIVFWGFGILLWLSSFLARSKSWWAGGIIGGVIALCCWIFADSMVLKILITVLAPPLGLLLDYLVSKNYRTNIARGGTGGFFGTFGGFSGGSGSSSGGFGGFSGGSSGGGGSSGSW